MPNTVVDYKVAINVWSRLDAGESRRDIATQGGPSETTVRRLATAMDLFDANRPLGDLNLATGWALAMCGKVKGYWENYQANRVKVENPRGPGRSRDAGNKENPAQAERSGHWRDLRSLARKIGDSLAAELPSLLGFKWFSVPPAPVRGANGQLELVIDQEERLLLNALKQHLPGHDVWKLERSWLDSVARLTEVLENLVAWAERHALLASWPRVSREEAQGGKKGFTEQFARMLVLERAEERCGLPRARWDWEFVQPNGDRTWWELRRTKNQSTFKLVASSPDKAELDALTQCYADILREMAVINEVQELVKAYDQTTQLREQLRDQLLNIANLAVFTGRCELWPA